MKLPKLDELVIAKVERIGEYAVYVELLEYAGVKAIVHVTELSTKAVKRIRDVVRENQTIACRVIAVNEEKGTVDLSLKRVSAKERKQKIEEWESEKKVSKLIRSIGELLKEEEKAKEIEEKAKEQFGALRKLLEEVKKRKEVLSEMGLSKRWQEELYKAMMSYWKEKRVHADLELKVSCSEGKGIGKIREFFSSMSEWAKREGIEIELKYVGAPRYRIRAFAEERKQVSSLLEKVKEEAARLGKQIGLAIG